MSLSLLYHLSVRRALCITVHLHIVHHYIAIQGHQPIQDSELVGKVQPFAVRSLKLSSSEPG